jgi:uncharacterized protein YndB with AHSA1/START domain
MLVGASGVGAGNQRQAKTLQQRRKKVPDIRHRVGIAVPQNRVYEMLSTRDGIAKWWDSQASGDSTVGGKLSFYFGNAEPSAVMDVIKLSPDDRVQWRCVEGPPDWVGTIVTFDLKESGGETVLLFTHSDWREPVEFMHHCSTKWATFLVGLRSGLEGGPFSASPDDTKISSNWR